MPPASEAPSATIAHTSTQIRARPSESTCAVADRPLTPAHLRLLDALAEVMARDYLTEQRQAQSQSDVQRSEHAPVADLDEAA